MDIVHELYNIAGGFVCVLNLVSDVKMFENRVLRRILDQRRMKWQESGENFIMRSSVISTLHQV
jgi:hypothetical protein